MLKRNYFITFITMLLAIFLFTVAATGASAMTGKGTNDDPFIITTVQDLDDVRKNLSAHYKLGANIDLYDHDPKKDDTGWEPIGIDKDTGFTGSLDGDGYSIIGLTIFSPKHEFIGLFGYTKAATFKNIALIDVDVNGRNYVGALAGRLDSGTKVDNVYSTGVVNGTTYVGGIVGRNGAIITNSYTTANVNGNDYVGGFVGRNDGGTIRKSYAAGLVMARKNVGGFGGFNNREITDAYWDMNTSDHPRSVGGTGYSTADMKKKATFVGWDFDTIWQINEGNGYPMLRGFKAVAAKPGQPAAQPVQPALPAPSAGGSSSNAGAFTDIKGHWAESSILEAVAKKITDGYEDGTFKPDDSVNRAQFAVLMSRALNLPAGKATSFTDQKSIPDWAGQEIANAVQAGIIDGYEDGAFRPDVTVSRTEMVIMIARALNIKVDANAVTSYSDDKDIPGWAKETIAAAQKQGLIVIGDGKQFVPGANGTRAEAAALLVKAANTK